MMDIMSKESILKYLEAIIVVTDIEDLRIESQKMIDKLSEVESVDSLLLMKFNVLKTQYLKEQKEWEQRNGLGHRVSKYTD
jgi:hypothetical protein